MLRRIDGIYNFGKLYYGKKIKGRKICLIRFCGPLFWQLPKMLCIGCFVGLAVVCQEFFEADIRQRVLEQAQV